MFHLHPLHISQNPYPYARILELMKTTYYWTVAERTALEKISSWDDMIPVALGILRRMSALEKPIVQICGPMTTGGRGSLAANMAFFKRAQLVASNHGLVIFDQTPFQDAMIRLSSEWGKRQEYCTPILEVFYRGVFQSGHVSALYFLPGWEGSVGSRWEREEGARLSLTILEYPMEWLHLIETSSVLRV